MISLLTEYLWLTVAGVCLVVGLILAVLNDMLPYFKSREAGRNSQRPRWLEWLGDYGFLLSSVCLTSGVVFALIWLATWFFVRGT
jgi:hypothetical protein